jgi:NarL family two-component system response regulator LiaR
MRAAENDVHQDRGAVPRAPIKLIIVDDHAVLRDGLRALFGAEPDIDVIGEAATLAEGIALTTRHRPDVVIIDISFPVGSGIDAIGTLRRECGDLRIVVLTVHNTAECLRDSMRAGADEFVPKREAFETLLKVVRFDASRHERTAQSLPSAALRGAMTVRQHTSPMPRLTLRERQVLLGVAQGYTSKQIAASLDRSVKTIVKHRSNMMRKLSLHDATAVTRYAVAHGLLTV